MATDITRQAGKGLQKQLLISSAVYDRGYERIFGKRRKSKNSAFALLAPILEKFRK